MESIKPKKDKEEKPQESTVNSVNVLNEAVSGISSTIDGIKANYVSLESRVQEIENFRNTPTIEGKINNIFSELERLQGAVNEINGKIKKLIPETPGQ